jgi:adenylate cyclase
MAPERIKRKLAAILSADVKDYSRLMGDDEVSTVRTIESHREVMAELIRDHRGRVVDSPGDNLLAEFASVVDAVQCAVEIQQVLKSKNAELVEDRRMEFRIGINLGDVIEEGDRIYGDGVNIAARLESLANGGGICISGSAFEQIENKLALGYKYMGEHSVKNITKPVRVYKVPMGPEEPTGMMVEKKGWLKPWQWRALVAVVLVALGAGAMALWVYSLRPSKPPVSSKQIGTDKFPDKPSIAVLPFNNMSGDPEQEYFSDGITEDLITALSKVSGLFVIARNSVFTYKGKATKVEIVGQELGVRYVLEGSVRKADNRVRITAQLVDAGTGGHIWAERYDREMKDIFALQDEVTQQIVTALAVKLTDEEWKRLARKGTENIDAYDYVLRGFEYVNRFTKEANIEGRRMFQKAIEQDPRYAFAYSRLGNTYMNEWSFGWSRDAATMERAFDMAQQAIALDKSEPNAHALLSEVFLWRKQYDQSIAEIEKAIQIAPNNADGLASFAGVLCWAGRPEEALNIVNRARQLNPISPVWYLWNLGHAYFLTEQLEKAISTMIQVIDRNPNFLPAYAYLAAGYIELGRGEEARAEAAGLERLSPYISFEDWRMRLPYKDPKVLERLFNDLEKVGIE